MLDMTQTQELFAKYQNELNTRLIKGRTVKEHPDVSSRRPFQNCKETAKDNLQLKESNKGASRIPLEISENQKQTPQRWRIYQRQGPQDPTEKRKKLDLQRTEKQVKPEKDDIFDIEPSEIKPLEQQNPTSLKNL